MTKRVIHAACAAGCMLILVLACAVPARAADAAAPPDREALQRDLLDRAAKALDKLRAGQRLTDDEMNDLRNARRVRDAARQPAPPDALGPARVMPQPGPVGVVQKPGAENKLRHDERLNVVDAAYYQIAELKIGKKEYDKAVASLEQLVKNSPDRLAVSLTHLNLGDLYRKNLSNTDKALEEYRKVGGEYAQDAIDRLAQMFEELDQVDKAIAQLEEIIKNPVDTMQKVLALRKLADILAHNGREDEAVATLQRLIQGVSYEDAVKVSKALLEEQDRRDKADLKEQDRLRAQMMRGFQGGAQGGRFGRRPGGPAAPDAGGAAGANPDMKPLQVRPVEPKRRDLQPTEKVIQPEEKGDADPGAPAVRLEKVEKRIEVIEEE